MDNEAYKALVSEIKLNMDKLEDCEIHDFVPDVHELDDGKLTTRYICRRCSGWVAGVNALWYRRGVADAGTTRGIMAALAALPEEQVSLILANLKEPNAESSKKG